MSQETPRTARSLKAILQLDRDNVATDDFWMMIDEGRLTIAQQRVGESLQVMLSIPRPVFDAFVDWYNNGRWKKPRAKRRAPEVDA